MHEREHVWTRVVLVDDHEIVRQGLRNLLERTGDLTVVGEAHSMATALAAIETIEADVLLLDLRLPDGDGTRVIDAGRRSRPSMRILILSGFADPIALEHARRAGASGYILKEAEGSTIVNAVRRVARGETVFADVPEAQPARPGRPSHITSSWSAIGLAPREQQVLALIAQGKLNKEIASELSLAEKSVRNITTTLFRKIGVGNRTEAAIRYRDEY